MTYTYTYALKKAIYLEPGDVCCGPLQFTEEGTVKSTVVVDKGVQVNWDDGTSTTRTEDYEFRVRS